MKTSLRFLADENFNGRVLDGLRRVLDDFDVVRVQDTVMYKASDPVLLAWAAEQDRILLTHDVNTITKYANHRISTGLPMPGVIEVRMSPGIGAVIDDLAIMIGASTPDEFENRVRYIPIK